MPPKKRTSNSFKKEAALLKSFFKPTIESEDEAEPPNKRSKHSEQPASEQSQVNKPIHPFFKELPQAPQKVKASSRKIEASLFPIVEFVFINSQGCCFCVPQDEFHQHQAALQHETCFWESPSDIQLTDYLFQQKVSIQLKAFSPGHTRPSPFVPSNPLYAHNAPSLQYFAFSPSLLKSALQKSVRRCRSAAAVRIALHFFTKDGGPQELLRRLAVIILEDAILTPLFARIVWLMLAVNKGYVLTEADVRAILNAVHVAAKGPFREKLPDVFALGKKKTEPPPLDPLSPTERTLLRAVAMRACYGGMGGDLMMLRGFVPLWAERFLQSRVFHCLAPGLDDAGKSEGLDVLGRWSTALANLEKHLLQDSIELENVGALRIGDIVPEAVDFHCSSMTDDLLNPTHASYSTVVKALDAVFHSPADRVKRLREVVWECWSKTNFKAFFEGKNSSPNQPASDATPPPLYAELGPPPYAGPRDDPAPPTHALAFAAIRHVLMAYSAGVLKRGTRTRG
eukprot:GCRY01004115.1.p1 GENE.GCRY01004115.1~~GCRY01004115.1.p1  ORF type:complete len:541 (-),score=126.32 GCRY01004115.1:378-1910(-)